jgi:hypothetical protein
MQRVRPQAVVLVVHPTAVRVVRANVARLTVARAAEVNAVHHTSVRDRVPVAMAQRFGNRLNFAPYFPILGEVSSLSITGVDYFRVLKQAQGVRPLGCCEQALEGAIGSPCHKCAIGDGEFSISATTRTPYTNHNTTRATSVKAWPLWLVWCGGVGKGVNPSR